MIDEIRELFAYDRWANARVLEAVDALEPDAYTRDLKSSFSSVHETLVHILSAEWIWLQRWNGTSPTGIPEDWKLDGLAAVKEKWVEVEDAQREFLETLDDAALERSLGYKNTRGQPFAEPLSATLRHVVNHSTYHRGQVATLMRQLDTEPPNTDLIGFYREQRTGAA